MVSAIATGELIFTPRIASLYGYSVLWMVIIAIFLKALISVEIGRYAVATGRSLLDGMTRLPGPRNWGVWAIIMPQFLVTVTTTAGMAGAAGSAVVLLFPGDFRLWAILFLVAAAALVLFGEYRGVELLSVFMSLSLIVALVVTAGLLFPGMGAVAPGIIPGLPANVNLTELLPWLGFMMSGAAGLIWYSYWLNARGYGAARHSGQTRPALRDAGKFDRADRDRLKGWIRLMAVTTYVASFLVLVLLIALLILGAELLMPRGLIPAGPEVTSVLSRLLSDIWGPPGAWLMVAGAFVAFSGTLVANMDGWGRMLSEGSVFIAKQMNLSGLATSARFYRYLYIIGLMVVVPAAMFFFNPEPVAFLMIAGIVEAIQIPIVALSTLYLDRRTLHPELKPSTISVILMIAASAFFAFFAAYFIYTRLIA